MNQQQQEQQDAFLAAYDDILTQAAELVEQRGKGYNVDTPITEYFPFGEISLAHEIHKKFTRLMNLVGAPEGHISDGPLDDSLYDLINYAAFLLAYRKLGIQPQYGTAVAAVDTVLPLKKHA
jgi:hypothetical protein